MLELQAYTVFLLLVSSVLACVPKVDFVQEIATNEQREISFPGTASEPSFSVRISAEGRMGTVAVLDGKGTEMQKLECPLLRDNPDATRQEMAAVREQFISKFVTADLDSDGHLDLAGVREFGAKWARYCVWLYDAAQHKFMRDFLAEQMELLTNLRALGNGQISSSHMGPTTSSIAVYRVVNADGTEPARQLVPLRSCLVELRANAAIQVIAQFEGERTVMRRRHVTEKDVGTILNQCAFGAL